MAASEDMATLAGRLSTFERPHHFAKRRASSAKKKAQSTISWSLGDPSPEALAKAGFYYKPSPDSPDNVTCFLCDRSLDGWEEGDNPYTEHLSHVPDCAWAMNVCIEQPSQDPDRAEEDPHSESLMDARRRTFRDVWPHEGRKGWMCKMENMVKAGWCYNPLPEADDCVQCFYCGVSLDGWEPKDDPWVEHHKRAPECHFFTLVEEAASQKPKGKKGKPRTSKVTRTSKASRMSTQSNVTMTSEAPSRLSSDDGDPAEEGDTVMTAANTAPRAPRGAKKATNRPATKRGRNTRTRQVSVMEDSVLEEPPLNEKMNLDDSVLPGTSMTQPPKARSKRQAAKASDEAVTNEDVPQPKPTRKASRAKKPQPQQRVSEDASQLQQELDEAAAPEIPVKSPKRATRGTKRMSDGLEKIESSVLSLPGSFPDEAEEAKPKHGRKGRPAKQSAEEPVVEDLPPPPPPQEETPKPKRGRGRPSKSSQERSVTEEPTETSTEQAQPKRKRGRPSKQSLEAADFPASEEAPEPIVAQNKLLDPVEAIEPAKAKGKGKKGRIASKQQHSNPPASREAPAAEQSKPQKDDHTLQAPQAHPAEDQLAPESPLASPEHSDAENRPPSSRPSITASQQRPTPRRSQTQSSTVPLAVSTPHTSPSKRNIISISTDHPWAAVDLETVFLPSPGSRKMREDKENLNMETALKRLTSPEKDMSVEDWILWNARGAEEELRGECERLISSFETEGNRALQCLESVEAA